MTDSTSDKIKGVANEAAGNVRQGAGRVLGDKEMEAKGVVQEKKGEGQQLKGDAKDAIKSGVDKV